MAETRQLVRLMRKDLPGEVTIERALRKIKGISFMTARAVRLRSGLSKDVKMGDLSDSQLSELSKILEHPEKFNLPAWILNRRKDYATGADSHILEANIDFSKREDLQRIKRIKSYRGIRHMLGLRVRGQRTRSTGRKGTTIGVSRVKKGASTTAKPSVAPKAGEKRPEVKKEEKPKAEAKKPEAKTEVKSNA